MIDARTLTVIAGHVALPWKHPASDYMGPSVATVSAPIQIELVRDELGFDGLLLSAALVMGGIQSRLPADEVRAASRAAGTDMLLLSDVWDDRRRGSVS